MNSDEKYLKYKICIVCNVPQSEAPGVIYAKFPNNIHRCRKWIRIIGDVRLLQLSHKKIQYRYVCGKHFVRSYYTKSGKHLTKDAVPTLLPRNVRPLKKAVVKLFPPLVSTTKDKVLLQCTQRIVPIRRAKTSQECMDHDYLQEEYIEPYEEEPNITVKQEKLDEKLLYTLPKVIPILHHNLTPNSQTTEIYTITTDRQVVPITRKVLTDGKECIIELSQDRISKSQKIIPVSNEVLSSILKKNSNIKIESIKTENMPSDIGQKPKLNSDKRPVVKSPREQKLHKKMEKLQKKNRQLKKLLKNIAIVDDVASPNIKKVIEKSIMNKQLTVGVNEYTQERQLAISVLKRALTAYNYLSCLMPLPNVCMLQKISMKEPIYSNTTKCKHLL